MANRNFNKQVVPARKKLAAGGPPSPKKPKSFDNTDRTPRPKSFNNTDTTDREQIIRDKILNNSGKDRPRSQGPRKKRPGSPRPLPIQPRDPRDKMTPGRPMPKLPGKPGRPGPSRPMPKLPGRPRPPMKGLTPEQIQRLKELFKKRRKGLDPKDRKFKKSIDSLKETVKKIKPKGRKKLMGGGSSSSREAMMHGFYNKDMGMGKKKK